MVSVVTFKPGLRGFGAETKALGLAFRGLSGEKIHMHGRRKQICSGGTPLGNFKTTPILGTPILKQGELPPGPWCSYGHARKIATPMT
jgi:hypothetical protein